MKKQLLRSLIVSSALVFVLGLVPFTAFAESGSDSNGDDKTTTTTSTTSEPESEPEPEDANDDSNRGGKLRERLQELKDERKTNRQTRLEANKLKVCENRKLKISSIMSRAVTRAEKQLALFDTISGRVKAFYVSKGHTLANYNELVAAVDAAKADAQANLATLKTMEAFDCSAEDPKGNAEAFKLALKSINQDLKDYRTAVKNLIVGVKSVQSEGGDQ